MVILGTLNIFLLFLIGYLYFNYKTGTIAALIYSVSPLIVVASRLPQAENAFIPLFLVSTILIKVFQNRKKYGVWKFYDVSGRLIRQEEYKSDKLIRKVEY
jgi:asparagine N-glycosylation enzyme membrane subunit Stt3